MWVRVPPSRGRDVQFLVALAVAIAGDAGKAQSLTNDLAKRFPEDTLVIFLGIRLQTLASAKAAKAVQTERHVRMFRGKLGFADLQRFVEQ